LETSHKKETKPESQIEVGCPVGKKTVIELPLREKTTTVENHMKFEKLMK